MWRVKLITNMFSLDFETHLIVKYKQNPFTPTYIWCGPTIIVRALLNNKWRHAHHQTFMARTG